MDPKFYVEIQTEPEVSKSSNSSDFSMKKISEPLDLSRNPAETMAMLSHYSRAGSSSEYSPAYSLEKRDTSLPDFVYFGNGVDGNLARPFLPYLQPISLIPAVNAQRDEQYQIFRLEMLKKLQNLRNGEPLKTNSKMRRSSRQRTNGADRDSNTDSSSNDVKGSTYYEKRAKNNVAAKKSRDRRRIKEYEIAIKASYLENMNRELRDELASARNEIDALKIELKKLQRNQ